MYVCMYVHTERKTEKDKRREWGQREQKKII